MPRSKGMFLKFGARVLKSDSLVTSLQVNSLPFSNNLLSLSLLTCFFFFFFFKLCIFGCSGSLLLYGLFSNWGGQGLLSSCSVQASRFCGFSCCRARAPGHADSEVVAPRLWSTASVVSVMGLVALQHMGSSWSRDQTCVSCTGGQILIHWATREALRVLFISSVSPVKWWPW